MIRECIVTSRREDGGTHIAPMGVHVVDQNLVIAPFKPSATLENLHRHGCAVINYVDDVRIFAGCLTGRRAWPVYEAERIDVMRLRDCLAHTEVEVDSVEADELRPRFYCRAVYAANHASFQGFNRAQAAVIEAAVLVSRLHMLPADKVDREIGYLNIAVQKTAGPQEHEAWGWLMAEIARFRTSKKEQSA